MQITIKDTGIGMEPEFLKNLYAPFEQANNGVAKKSGGTGLGMAITKNPVALMDGSIDVQAALDAGMNGHIAKPIDVDILYKTISEYA
ncbi:ATP-binding protein [uncultured Phascolarctobacterium sp.]|uniref:ATP-binding protein n=1 Tax=uncultured Phascolarctobacterium sp. TaxID=512296 RepID=UPI0025DF2E84|nr:ATP-binding protein [uncultured Phascolarctobacterium sp.]